MRITSHGSGKITVNGRDYVGKCVSIVNGRVVIDGVVADAGPSTGVINIVVHGDCDTVENEAGSIEVHGTVKGNVNTGSGSIKCESVGGSVQAGSGDITCGNVGGSARSGSGDVFCLRSRA